MQFTLKLQESFEELFNQPQKFNQLTRTTILQLSKIHNSHNRLLPPDFVADLIDKLHTMDPFQNRKTSLQFAFCYNILRHIVLSNFYQLKDNKVFAVIALIYAQKLSSFYHQLQNQQKSLAIIKHIAQMAIINQITLKYLQKNKIFFPQFIRTLKLSIEKLQYSICRNIKHSKSQVDIQPFSTTEAVIKTAFSKDTQKSELLEILIGLLNYILKQASSFFNSSANKKEILKLNDIQSIIEKLQYMQIALPENIKSQLILPPEFKKYSQQEANQMKQDEPIFLEEPIYVRQLTPRFYDEEQSTKTKLLRKKKNKLEKKMQLELKQSTHQKLQERRVIENVKKEKIQRQFKKETFILQKQTEEAKKAYKQMKKVKTIKKESKLGRKGKK